ncbi:MAG: chorismate-binding protein [Duncaniella sp.]|nr:chorismate-binding protein [Duncaniella sp.]
MTFVPVPKLKAEAARACISRCVPFALYRLPSRGAGEWRFVASLPDAEGRSAVSLDEDGADCFFISRYGADEPYMAGVRADMDARAALRYLKENPEPGFAGACEKAGRRSTNYAAWLSAFNNCLEFVRAGGRKVVLSRMAAAFSCMEPSDIAEALASMNPPGHFTYLCFTPENGLWYGSTPELLLEQPKPDRLNTMALAGTLPASSDEPWDKKNKAEHAVVADFICATLSSFGLEVRRGRTRTLASGAVRHLCTPISATGEAQFGPLLSALNPTPAVAGVPRELAMAVIDAVETHQRRCYAGAVGVRLGGCVHAYVNLRCGFASPALDRSTLREGFLHNIYGGGGIMPDSDSETEWDEVDRKLAPILSILDAARGDGKDIFDVSDLELLDPGDTPSRF